MCLPALPSSIEKEMMALTCQLEAHKIQCKHY
jgi:hypothetical protein